MLSHSEAATLLTSLTRHANTANVDDKTEKMFQTEHICLHNQPDDDADLHPGQCGGGGLVHTQSTRGHTADISDHVRSYVSDMSAGTVQLSAPGDGGGHKSQQTHGTMDVLPCHSLCHLLWRRSLSVCPFYNNKHITGMLVNMSYSSSYFSVLLLYVCDTAL